MVNDQLKRVAVKFYEASVKQYVFSSINNITAVRPLYLKIYQSKIVIANQIRNFK